MTSTPHAPPAPFDVARVRADFPLLNLERDGPALIYLDNAATTQKPACVIEAVERFYREQNANVHRAAHRLSAEATEAFEGARERVRRFINAAATEEVIWTRGTTDGLNLLASSLGRLVLGPGDEVLIGALEHHANIVPWQVAVAASGARLRVIPCNERCELDQAAYQALLGPRTRIVALGQVSNAVGTVNPVAAMIAAARQAGAITVIDGAQAVSHWPLDVQALACDFYLFSGHKLFAPSGIGVLYGRREWLERMPPYQTGGEMIERVTFETTTYNRLPFKFEAGTPNMAGAIGLGAAIAYLEGLDREGLARHERALLARTERLCRTIPGLRQLSRARERIGLFSFVIDGAHPQDVGMLLDQQGIAVRTGHHCAMPLMERLGLVGTVRASFAFYNTEAEIDALADGLQRLCDLL